MRVSNSTVFVALRRRISVDAVKFTRSFDGIPLVKEGGTHGDGDWDLSVLVAQLEK
jgi:hypothetical protein